MLRCILPLVLCPGILCRLKLTLRHGGKCGLRRVLARRCDRGVLNGERTSFVHCGKIQRLARVSACGCGCGRHFSGMIGGKKLLTWFVQAIFGFRAPPQYQAAAHHGSLAPEKLIQRCVHCRTLTMQTHSHARVASVVIRKNEA